ncbi:MAG: MFS transporter [Candidatus Micrarchaeia archaeon]
MRSVALGVLLVFAFSLSFNGVLATVLPLYMRAKGIGVVEIGLVYAAYPVIFQLLRVVFGALSDQIGVRVLLLASGMLQALTSAVYFFAPNALFYGIGKVGEGIAASMMRGVDRRFLFSESHIFGAGRISGWYYAALWGGLGIGSFVAGYLILAGFEWAFAVIATTGMAIALVGLLLGKEKIERKEGIVQHLLNLRKVGSKIKRLTALLLLDGIASSIVGSFVLVLLLKEVYALSPEMIGSFLMIVYVVQAVGALALGRLADKIESKRLYAASTFGIAALLLAAGWIATAGLPYTTFLVAICMWKLFDVLASSCVNKITVAHSAPHALGRDMNFVLTGYWLGASAGYAGVGALIAATGFPAAFFVSGALQAVLAMLLLALL